jgi:uncharacterized protein
VTSLVINRAELKPGAPQLQEGFMVEGVKTDFTPLLAKPDCVIALVGASEHPEKYGSIIYRDLVGRGYRVLGVNPNRDTVHGDACYPSLKDLPVTPDIIDVVVPASIGTQVVRDAVKASLDNVWLQPGAESADLIRQLEESGLAHDYDSCIMVSARRVKSPR